jgi:hypothetical protein
LAGFLASHRSAPVAGQAASSLKLSLYEIGMVMVADVAGATLFPGV